MAHYITHSLEEGEQIVLRGRLHWIAICRYIFSALLLLLIAIGFVVAGYITSRQEMYITAAIIFVVATIIYLIGRLLRTKCEFAVTNSRFIQKDGIFNIKMTEIPLFKIETVNFYQSLWQRIMKTGCIELVGSGGTSHRVDYIEHPLLVRKTIVSTINKHNQSNIE